MHRLSLWLFSAAWLVLCCSTAWAQSTASGSESNGQRSPAFAYMVACLSGLLIMLIICMPSRKR